jgi:hypothetical protein
MRFAKYALALMLMLSLGLRADRQVIIQPPKGFEGDVYKATFALYEHRGNQERFICTTEAYEKITGGYRLIGAGHCIDPKADFFAVAENIGGSETKVTVIKSELDKNADLAVFEMKTDKVYPVIPMGTIDGERIGDVVVNVNFAVGIAKQLSEGKISSVVIPSDGDEGTDVFLAQIFGAGGSSGSAVVSADTHKIIGIVIYGFQDDNNDDGISVPLNIGMGVEPIDKFAAFLSRPAPPPPPTISDQEMKDKFGLEHSFMLTVHGANPVFIQAGYKFKVDTYGFELDDAVYYDVPVYIIKTDDGSYRLQSTGNANYGIDIDLIGKP